MVTRRNSLFFKRTFEKPPTKTFLELCNEFLVQRTLGKEHLTKPIKDHEPVRVRGSPLIVCIVNSAKEYFWTV